MCDATQSWSYSGTTTISLLMHVAELELGDIMSGDRDALDGTADDVPLQEGDHVSDTVT